jgi:hypothetical protein
MHRIEVPLEGYIAPPTPHVSLQVNGKDVPFDMVRGRAKPHTPIYPGQRVNYSIHHSGGIYSAGFTASSVMEYAW